MGEAISFINVTLKITVAGGSSVESACLLSLDGLGSSREVNKLKCLNDTVVLSVSSKEYDTLTFEAPDDETVDSFWDTCQQAYDGNTLSDLTITFDNAPDENPGALGTVISGSGKVTAFNSANNSSILATTISWDWDGEPTRDKPVPGTP